jgi:hypothetical protein
MKTRNQNVCPYNAQHTKSTNKLAAFSKQSGIISLNSLFLSFMIYPNKRKKELIAVK